MADGPQVETEERLKSSPKIIGVIGPHAIGKDTIISDLVDKIPGVRGFSIGQYLREKLYDVEDKEAAEEKFASLLEEARVKSEDARLNGLTGLQLVGEIKHNFDNRLPIPEEVADWILKGFLDECPDDTKVVLQSGGPYGELDLKFMEQNGHPPSAIILLAPTSKEWMETIVTREELRGRYVDFNAQKEWDKWKSRAAKVLRLAHSKNIPVMHVNLENPGLPKEEVNDKLTEILKGYVNKVTKGEKVDKVESATVN